MRKKKNVKKFWKKWENVEQITTKKLETFRRSQKTTLGRKKKSINFDKKPTKFFLKNDRKNEDNKKRKTMKNFEKKQKTTI